MCTVCVFINQTHNPWFMTHGMGISMVSLNCQCLNTKKVDALS